MRTLLICHHDDPFDHDALARWLSSFSTLAGLLLLHTAPRRLLKNLLRERRRVGSLRLLDVLSFRLYRRLFLRRHEAQWMESQLKTLHTRFPPLPDVPVLHTTDPNTPEAEHFIRSASPDLVIARCKTILQPRIFQIPPDGTFVLHPGICPEYRNAHGCFWALARGDPHNVGLTLLRVDPGIDTGPVFAQYRITVDEANESPFTAQYRCVLDHLDALQDRLRQIHAGHAAPIPTAGRPSQTWGQPWLSAYLAWRLRARRAKNSSRMVQAVGEGEESQTQAPAEPRATG